MNVFKKSIPTFKSGLRPKASERDNQKMAFTLVEIVVVIGIMAFLSTIIYSSFGTSRAKSRDQQRVSDISTIQLALEQYFQKYGVYPVTLSLLTKPLSPIAYLAELPKPPLASDPLYEDNYFPITKTSDGSNYCVSYHLWTTFEKSNEYLNAKKSFNSLNLSSKALYKCGTASKTGKDASLNPLVYDVMP